MMGRGPEPWHPSPEFFYQTGGGPMFDMGPYYLTALLNMLGPVKRIMGMASIAIPDRTITSKPLFGKKISVETPDHICGTLEFENGAIGTIVMSFATMFAEHPPLTVFGTDGTLAVPDPNTFDGDVKIRKAGDADWRVVPPAFVKGYGRAVGLADMCYAIRTHRPFRTDAQQGLAVLDLMQGFLESSIKGKAVTPQFAYQRPAPMPADLPLGTLDE
jgi:predicted dehydrogenase